MSNGSLKPASNTSTKKTSRVIERRPLTKLVILYNIQKINLKININSTVYCHKFYLYCFSLLNFV